jgi:glutamine amidotransferase
MSASAPVHVSYDLDRFAVEGGERHQNRDGWGIVIYEGRDAQYFREAEPASNSPLDRFVREHATPHTAVMAHVRRASAGGRELANTHPFRRVRRGQVHHFAHNGTLHGIERRADAEPLIRERVGDTDSELAFLLLLDRLDRNAPDIADTDTRFALFRTFCQDMTALGPANFLWSDGATIYVHADQRVHETPEGSSPPRPPGLHVLRPEPGALGPSHACAGARFSDMPRHIVLFASVPLSDAPWEPLPRGTVLAVSAGLVVQSGSSA